MGRRGVSYGEFEKAAYDLLENNAILKAGDITIEKVRAVLKTGSHGTLGPYLKKWKEGVKNGGEWVKNHVDEDFELLTGVMERLREEANAKTLQIQEEARLKIEEAMQALTRATNENDRLQMAMEERNKQLAEIQHEKTTTIAENIKLKEVCETLNLKLGDKNEEVDRLSEMNKSLNQNLKHFHEHSESKLQALELDYENKFAELKNKLTELKFSNEKLQSDLSDVKIDAGILRTSTQERQKFIDSLTKENTKLAEQISGHSKEVIHLNSELIIIGKDFDDLRKAFKMIEDDNQDKISAINALEQDLTNTKNDNTELKKQLQQASATVESLAKKNFDLARERVESTRKVDIVDA